MPAVCRFKFPEGTDRETMEANLALAIIAAECTFGKPRVRIAAAYSIAKEKPLLAIDVSTEVGEYIAQLFTGLMMRHVDEEAFSVDRITNEE